MAGDAVEGGASEMPSVVRADLNAVEVPPLVPIQDRKSRGGGGGGGGSGGAATALEDGRASRDWGEGVGVRCVLETEGAALEGITRELRRVEALRTQQGKTRRMRERELLKFEAGGANGGGAAGGSAVAMLVAAAASDIGGSAGPPCSPRGIAAEAAQLRLLEAETEVELMGLRRQLEMAVVRAR
jgi:hypothetical protein